MKAKDFLKKENRIKTSKCGFFVRMDKIMMDKDIHLKKEFESDIESFWDEFYKIILESKTDDTFIEMQREYFNNFFNNNKIFQDGYNKNFLKMLEDKAICDENTEKIMKEFDSIDNIVKHTCKELGLTYKELGEAIGVKESTLNKIASTGVISEQITKAILLYLETLELKKQLEDCDILKKALKNLVK